MEDDDLQRPYSVTTRDDLKEKMNNQINDISEIFCLSNPDATSLLMKHQWNSQLLSDRLCQDLSGLTESGLNQDLSDSSCDTVDDKVSTPSCSHEYSTTYWSKYLEKSRTRYTIPCPHQDCRAEVEWNTMENLTVRKKNKYDEDVLRSYLEKSKRQIKQCPAPGCSYFIEFHQGLDAEEYGFNVVCLCGHTLCWRCSLESHAPVTCNNASDWLSRDLKKLSVSLKENNTKPCPHCQSPLKIVRGGSRSFRFLPCVKCSGLYCWECMKSKEAHKTESGFYGDCVEHVTEQDALDNGAEVVDTSCLDRWEGFEVSMEEARTELQAFEESNNMVLLGFLSKKRKNNMVLREGLMLIVQCRQFLKWSCVYEYIHLEESKKDFLRFLQDYANTLVQSYAETLKEETGKVTCSRGNLSAVTSSIGNYFYNFSKALQDGLDVVEVMHYDDFSPCWLCNRCTYANTWLHKVCQMCCDSLV